MIKSWDLLIFSLQNAAKKKVSQNMLLKYLLDQLNIKPIPLTFGFQRYFFEKEEIRDYLVVRV